MKTKQVMARTHIINTAPPTTEMPMIVSLLNPWLADGSGKGASGTEKKKRDYVQIRLNALLFGQTLCCMAISKQCQISVNSALVSDRFEKTGIVKLFTVLTRYFLQCCFILGRFFVMKEKLTYLHSRSSAFRRIFYRIFCNTYIDSQVILTNRFHVQHSTVCVTQFWRHRFVTVLSPPLHQWCWVACGFACCIPWIS